MSVRFVDGSPGLKGLGRTSRFTEGRKERSSAAYDPFPPSPNALYRRPVTTIGHEIDMNTTCEVMSPAVPADLPIAGHAQSIARAVAEHPVTLVVGATGSGKSTQLAKICLGAGRGAGAMIGHTQPRRIAARSVAARIASELGAGFGRLVGYQVRFRRHTAPDTRIKLMTDGILLAEIQGDRNLRAYDTPHHRRGARADPQRRLRPRLSAPTRAPAPGPSRRRGLGNAGGGEAACVLRRGAGHRGGGPDPPHRDPVPARRGGRRRSGEGRGGAPGSRRRAG